MNTNLDKNQTSPKPSMRVDSTFIILIVFFPHLTSSHLNVKLEGRGETASPGLPMPSLIICYWPLNLV